MPNLNLLKYRIAKSWQLLPNLVARPDRIPWLFQGVSPGRLIALDVAWLRRAGIRTVLDIGANVGQFATTIHHLLPEATIHSFEPLEDCFELMVKRMTGVSHFFAYKVAIGSEDSIVDFERNDFTQSSSVLPMAELHRQAFPWSAASRVVQVESRRLDSILHDTVLTPHLLIKIDVQGYEDKVLLGGEATIRSADFVIIETSFEALYKGQASFEQIYEMMIGYGFKYGGNIDQLLSPSDGVILHADALFLKRD